MQEWMKWAIAAGMALAVMAAVAEALKSKSREKPKARKLMSDREKAMYERLKECFPEANVLAQVSMGALLTAKTVSSRNTFDRKIVDFVLCGKGFDVWAVIELDDSSHKGKEKTDAMRDEMLRDAGYRTLRFKNIPNREQAKEAVSKAMAPK